MIIGLSGYARSGKDEAAKVLVNEFGYRRVAFADKLREFLYAQDPIIGTTGSEIILPNRETFEVATPENIENWLEFPCAWGVHIRVSDVIRRVSWEGYKETQYYFEIRNQLQRLGTEAGRETLWDNIWVDAALTGVSTSDNIVVTDVRYRNEADAIKKRGGLVVRVNRSGNGPATDAFGNVHKSETALDNYKFDYTVNNDFKVIDDWHQHIRWWLDAVGTDLYFKHVIGD